MTVQKTAVDIPITTGLSQKFDERLAPLGVSIQALNLVKNKRDTLQKRLGLTALNYGPTAGTTGLNLGTHSDRLVGFTSSLYSYASGFTQTTFNIGSYSDNTGTYTNQALVPDVLVGPKRLQVSTDGTALEYDHGSIGDYELIAWTAPNEAVGEAVGGSLTSNYLWYMVVENTTNNIIVQPTLIYSSSSVSQPRVVGTGTYLTILFQVSAEKGQGVYGVNWLSSSLALGAITLIAAVSSGNGLYDADAIVGLPNNLVLAYCPTNTSVSIVQVAIPGLAVVNACTVTDSALAGGTGVVGIGVTANETAAGGSGLFSAAYSYVSSLGETIVGAVMGNRLGWPATLAGTAIYTLASTSAAASAIAIAYLGVLPNASGSNDSFGVWFAPYGAQLSGNPIIANPSSHTPVYAVTQYVPYYQTTFNGPVSGTSANFRTTYGVVPASRPYFENGVPYIICYVPSPYQGGYVMMVQDSYGAYLDPAPAPMRCVANIGVRQALSPILNTSLGTGSYTLATGTGAQGVPGSCNVLPHIQSATTLPYSSSTLLLGISGDGFKFLPTLYNVEFASRHMYASDMYGESLAYACGTPGVFDGSRAVEIAYPYYPEFFPTYVDSVVPFSSTGNITQPMGVQAGPQFNDPSVNNDVYNYIFTYEWIDLQGQVHISGRSPPVTINSVAALAFGATLDGILGVHVTFQIPVMGISGRMSSGGPTYSGPTSILGQTNTMTIGVYRTIRNGSTYYRLSDPYRTGSLVGTGTDSLGTGSSFYNSLMAPYITFVDATDDGVLESQPLLYGDGTDSTGTADNLCPPSSGIMTSHRGRLFLADGNNVWYTKQYNPNGNPLSASPGFNETSFLISVGDSTPITGLASMDTNLIIFKRRGIYYITGDGPNPQGNQNDIEGPYPIPTQLGCVDSRSIEVTPDGAYFYSDAGYRIVDRSLTVQYPGTAIENELATYPYITSAVLHPNTNRMILCACQDDNASVAQFTGEWITLDYVLDAWTTAQCASSDNTSGMIAAGIGLAPAPSELSGGLSREEPTLHFMDANGVIWRENNVNASGKTYCDIYHGHEFYVNTYFQASEFKPAQSIDGFARAFSGTAVVDLYDNCNFTMEVTTDYEQVSNQGSWNSDQLSSNLPAYPEVYVKNQRCRTVSVKITETAPTDASVPATGQGYSLKGISMNVGVYPSTSRSVPQDRK